MGLTVKLQDEFGKVLDEIQDRKDLLGPYIPALREASYHCLRFIDRYANTYFNQLQMETFISEWERLLGTVQERDRDIEIAVQRLFGQVKELALRCQREPHLYIKFEGD